MKYNTSAVSNKFESFLSPSDTSLLQVPSINREDSLAELEISFNRRVRSGELTADVIEEEPQAPSIGLIREDSLAQLKSSYRKQVSRGYCCAV